MKHKEYIAKLIDEWAGTEANLADNLRIRSRSTIQRIRGDQAPQGPLELLLAALAENPALRTWVDDFNRRNPLAVSEAERQRKRGRERWQKKQGKIAPIVGEVGEKEEKDEGHG